MGGCYGGVSPGEKIISETKRDSTPTFRYELNTTRIASPL